MSDSSTNPPPPPHPAAAAAAAEQPVATTPQEGQPNKTAKELEKERKKAENWQNLMLKGQTSS